MDDGQVIILHYPGLNFSKILSEVEEWNFGKVFPGILQVCSSYLKYKRRRRHILPSLRSGK